MASVLRKKQIHTHECTNEQSKQKTYVEKGGYQGHSLRWRKNISCLFFLGPLPGVHKKTKAKSAKNSFAETFRRDFFLILPIPFSNSTVVHHIYYQSVSVWSLKLRPFLWAIFYTTTATPVRLIVWATRSNIRISFSSPGRLRGFHNFKTRQT